MPHPAGQILSCGSSLPQLLKAPGPISPDVRAFLRLRFGILFGGAYQRPDYNQMEMSMNFDKSAFEKTVLLSALKSPNDMMPDEIFKKIPA